MRYLTRWALKADKSSLKSSNILTHVFHRLRSPRYFGNRSHPLVNGPVLPVPVFIGLHFLKAVISPNDSVHTSIVATKNGSGKPQVFVTCCFCAPRPAPNLCRSRLRSEEHTSE